MLINSRLRHSRINFEIEAIPVHRLYLFQISCLLPIPDDSRGNLELKHQSEEPRLESRQVLAMR